MSFMEKAESWVKNWTCIQPWDNVSVIMRRELKIRVAFEPVRMGAEHLHQAYELIVPVQQRRLNAKKPLEKFAEATTETVGRCSEEGRVS
jgi:hypothetical protein